MTTRPPHLYLQDALLSNQTAAHLRAAIAPKSVAARSLAARLCWAAPTGSVQLFSSIASLLGSGGQASYAAANALLDATAEGWQSQGLAATSIAWGAWGGAGMAAASPAVAARLARVGVAAIQPLAGLAALQHLAVAAQAGTAMAAALLWERLLVDGRQQAPFFAEFAAVAAAAAPGNESADASVTVAVARRRRGERNSKQAAVKQPAEVQQPAEVPAAVALPAWATMDQAERFVYFSGDLAAMVERAAGKAVGPNEPLLSAGLDSLGKRCACRCNAHAHAHGCAAMWLGRLACGLHAVCPGTFLEQRQQHVLVPQTHLPQVRWRCAARRLS